eukprot:scaffold3600_cov387-Prasinococcus_capsulatus_cf.AAC.5
MTRGRPPVGSLGARVARARFQVTGRGHCTAVPCSVQLAAILSRQPSRRESLDAACALAGRMCARPSRGAHPGQGSEQPRRAEG